MLRQLMAGPANLGSIAKKTGLSRQLASHHMSVLMTSGIVEQRAAGSVRLYTLTERGSKIAQKVLGPAPQISDNRDEDRVRPADLVAPAVAVVVMLVAAAKFLTTPEAPVSWLLGGAIVSGVLFVILRTLNRPSKKGGR
jgi:DNA-binding transcriptional ArsR family regulator